MHIGISGVTVRLAFRILFTVLFIYIPFISRKANGYAYKRRLLQNKRTPVPETAGWLGLEGLLEAFWIFRSIPSFKWWLLMAAVGVLSKLTDFATATVHQTYIQSFCDFGTGMVLALNGSDAFSIPPWNGKPPFVAGDAQITSQNNGCSRGIYRKVNGHPLFCAAPSDVLGTWKCQPNGDDITYEYKKFTQDDIHIDLLEKDLIYLSSWNAATATPDPYLYSHLVIWGTSTYDDSDEVFEVKASIDTTAHYDDDKIMHNMHCIMDAPEGETISRNIPSNTTLLNWKTLFQGYMYNGFNTTSVDDAEEVVAWYLNTLIMVAGGSDYLLANAPVDDPKQGCLAFTTIIPNWLIALLFLTIFVCVIMSGLAILLRIQIRRHQNADLVKDAPLDLWTWMVQAVAESSETAGRPVDHISVKELQRWNISIANGETLRLEKCQDDNVQSLSLLGKSRAISASDTRYSRTDTDYSHVFPPTDTQLRFLTNLDQSRI